MHHLVAHCDVSVLSSARREQLDDDQIWEIISLYFAPKGLVTQQIKSFNFFATSTLQEMIDALPPIIVSRNEEEIDLEEDFVSVILCGALATPPFSHVLFHALSSFLHDALQCVFG